MNIMQAVSTEASQLTSQAYMDRQYGGRFHELGATVRVVATGEIGWVQQRDEPWVGGTFYLHEKPGIPFDGIELETIVA